LPYDFVIFLPPEKPHDARTISTITLRAAHDVRTVASWSPCDMYNRTNIVRAPFGHPEVSVRHPQSVSSKLYKRRLLTRNFSQAPYGVLKYVTT